MTSKKKQYLAVALLVGFLGTSVHGAYQYGDTMKFLVFKRNSSLLVIKLGKLANMMQTQSGLLDCSKKIMD